MSELLECPDCGDQRFSWMSEQVQFGSVHEYESGTRDGESLEMGEVVDTDIRSKGPWCTGCDEHKDIDDLVPIDG